MVESTKKSVPNKSKYELLKTQSKYSKREGHCACSKDNLVYVFGGVLENTESVTESNELNIYDTDQQTWSAPTTYGDLPSSKSAATVVCINDFLYLFGGLNAETGWSDELHKFNIATGEWSQLKHDFSPVSRDKHCAVANGNNMYVFGGFGPAVENSGSVLSSDSSDFTWFNDVFKYDTVRNTWIQLADNNKRPAPTPRAAASMSAMRHSTEDHPVLYVFGGRDTVKRQGDLFAFDTETKEWTPLTPKENPMARSFHQTVCLDYNLGYMVLIGGRSNRDKHFAEIHLYNRETNCWYKIKNADGIDGRGQMTACLIAGDGDLDTTPDLATFNVVMIGGSAGFDAVTRAAQIVYDSVYKIAFTQHTMGPEGDNTTNQNTESCKDEVPESSIDEVPEKKSKLEE